MVWCPTKLKKFHCHHGNQSFLTAYHQPSLSHDLTSCWTLWAVHQPLLPTHTNFHTLCVCLFLSQLSVSLSLLDTDTCSIYNFRGTFWTGSCPLPTLDHSFSPKRQHPLLFRLLPMEGMEKCVYGLKIVRPTLSAPGTGHV